MEKQWNEKIKHIDPVLLEKYNAKKFSMYNIYETKDGFYQFVDGEILLDVTEASKDQDLTMELLHRELFRLKSMQSVFGEHRLHFKQKCKGCLLTIKKLEWLINKMLKEQIRIDKFKKTYEYSVNINAYNRNNDIIVDSIRNEYFDNYDDAEKLFYEWKKTRKESENLWLNRDTYVNDVWYDDNTMLEIK